MLYDFGTVNQIERLFAQVFKEVSVRGKDFKSTCWTAFARNPNASFSKVDSHHRHSALGELES